MKKSILILTAVVAMVMVGCKENPYMQSPGSTEGVPGTMPVTVPDTNGIEISIDSAIAICKSLPADVATAEIYKLSGVVTVNSTNPDDVPTKYKNINFKMSDNGGKTSISCYYINNINNKKFTKMTDVPLVGSKLTVQGQLINYKGNTPELKDGFIVRIDSMVRPTIPDTIRATCAEAKAAALALPENNTPSKDIYVVEGYVQNEGYSATISRGQQTFWIADTQTGGKVFEAYWCDVPDGATPVAVGDKVRLTGKIMKYGSTPEMKNGKITILETAQ